jgi:hypothetical protein
MEQAERLFDSLDSYKLFDDRTASRSHSITLSNSNLLTFPIVGKTRYNRSIIIIIIIEDTETLDPLESIIPEISLHAFSPIHLQIQTVVRVNPKKSRVKTAHTKEKINPP